MRAVWTTYRRVTLEGPAARAVVSRLQAPRGTSSVEAPTDDRPASSRRRSLVRALIPAVAVIGLDQLTKHLVVTELSGGDVVRVVDEFVTLELTRNSGGAFGIGQAWPEFFLVASIAIAAMIVVLAWRADDPRWLIPLGMVLGGGIGNLIDRIARSPGGEVVDFIDLQVWPVFNVADAAISLGVAAMFWLSFRSSRDES